MLSLRGISLLLVIANTNEELSTICICESHCNLLCLLPADA